MATVYQPSSSSRNRGRGSSHGTPSRIPFRPDPKRRYIAFNKPYEILSQFTQPEQSSKGTLALFGFPGDVYPIGRLDYDSEGLLLLSNDPRLNNVLLNPNHRHPRSYLAQVEGIPGPDALRRLETGVVIEGRRTLPAQTKLLLDAPPIPPRPVPIRFRASVPTAWLKLTLTEGRNRQVRRMTASVGHPTLRLVRVAIGGLDLLQLLLAPGMWRDLNAGEVSLALQQLKERDRSQASGGRNRGIT